MVIKIIYTVLLVYLISLSTVFILFFVQMYTQKVLPTGFHSPTPIAKSAFHTFYLLIFLLWWVLTVISFQREKDFAFTCMNNCVHQYILLFFGSTLFSKSVIWNSYVLEVDYVNAQGQYKNYIDMIWKNLESPM